MLVAISSEPLVCPAGMDLLAMVSYAQPVRMAVKLRPLVVTRNMNCRNMNYDMVQTAPELATPATIEP